MKKLSGAGGGGASGRTPKIVDDNLFSRDLIEFTMGVAEGPIAGLIDGPKSFYLDDTPLVSPGGDNNFTPFHLHLYHGSETPTPVRNVLGGITSNSPVGVTLAESVGLVRTTSAALRNQIDALEVRIVIQQLYVTNTSGDQLENTAKFKIQFRQAGTTTWQNFVDGTDQIEITGKTSSGYTREFTRRVPRINNDWEIRVEQISPDNSTTEIVSLVWDSFQSVTMEDRSYENLAVIRGLGQASDRFQNIPTFSGVFGMKLIKVPSNFNPVTRHYAGVWDGTFKLAFTDSIVWVLYDLLMSPVYGMKRYMPHLQADRFSFYDVARNWCDQLVLREPGAGYEPRFTFNHVFDQKTQAFEVIHQIAGVFSGVLLSNRAGVVKLKVDRPEAPVQVFGPESMVKDSLQYQFTDVASRVNNVSVRFTNPNLGFQPDVRWVSDQTLIERNGDIPDEIEALGALSVYEAQRRAWSRIIQANSEVITVTFQTARAGLMLEIFDLIAVSDPDMLWGLSGRVKNVVGNTITLRDPLFVPIGSPMTLTVQTPTGPETMTVTSAVANTSTLTISTGAWPENAAPRAQFTLSHSTLGMPKPFRVIGLVEDSSNPEIVTITALEHNVNKYTDVENLQYSGNTNYQSITPAAPTAPRNVSLAYGPDTAVTLQDGEVIPRLEITWERPAQGTVTEYVVYHRRKDRDTFSSFRSPGPTAYIEGAHTEATYEVYVVAIGRNGRSGPPSNIVEMTIGRDTTPPGTPTGLSSQTTNSAISLIWEPVQDLDLYRYEVFLGETPGTPQFKTTANQILIEELAAETTYKLHVRAIDTSGNVSPWSTAHTAVTKENPLGPIEDLFDDEAPDTPGNLLVTSALQGDGSTTVVEATWDAATAPDFTHFELEVTQGGGAPIVFITPVARHTWSSPPNTSISVRVRALDRANNRSPWSAPTVMTTLKDNLPPATPTGFTVSGGFGTFWMKWNPNTEADFSHYEIHESTTTTRGSTITFKTVANQMVRADLDDGVTRHYWIRAVDVSGNASPWSNRVAGTTTPLQTEDLMGLIDEGSFKTDVEPVKIITGGALPTTRITAFIQFNGTLYKWQGSAYVPVVSAAELSGLILSDQIDAKGLKILDLFGNDVFSYTGEISPAAYVTTGGNTISLSTIAANSLTPSIHFVGEFAVPPTEASLGPDWRQNAVYKNTVDGKSYILTGTPLAWMQYLSDGNAFYLTIESTNGTVFRVGQASTTLLKARLFKNGAEVTDQTPSSWFRWRRVSADPGSDTTWNSNYTSGYKQIDVSVDTVNSRATFFCDIISS